MCRIIAHTKIINYLCSRKATHRAQIIPPKCFPLRRDGRVVDYSSLENCRTERCRGFESLSLRNPKAADRIGPLLFPFYHGPTFLSDAPKQDRQADCKFEVGFQILK